MPPSISNGELHPAQPSHAPANTTFPNGHSSIHVHDSLGFTIGRLPRKVTRPSTAPVVPIQDPSLLPSDKGHRKRMEMYHHMNPFQVDGHPPSPDYSASSCDTATQTQDELVMVAATRLSPELLPSPFTSSEESSPCVPAVQTHSAFENTEWDWSTFIKAYANGKWDPHRAPVRPKSSMQPAESLHSPPDEFVHPNPVNGAPNVNITPRISDHMIGDTQKANGIPLQPSNGIGNPQESQSQKLGFGNSMSFRLPAIRTAMPLTLPPASQRLRNSFSTVTSSTQTEMVSSTTPAANAELQTTVATMRWAASRVDISPLALPSPEHELADPMRGITTAIPGAHLSDNLTEYPMTPGLMRRSRLSEFWEGTTDVDEVSKTSDAVIAVIAETNEDSRDDYKDSSNFVSLQDSPTDASAAVTEVLTSKDHKTSLAMFSVPPATAPPADGYHSNDAMETDYFGHVANHSHPTTNGAVLEKSLQPSHQLIRQDSVRLTESGSSSAPPLPRRMNPTRQTSMPLPVLSTSKEGRLIGGRVTSDPSNIPRMVRISKEERSFEDLHYLIPPHPPNELERRRALYKFNIWNTGADMNFDRIAHLAKLVFNTKGVTITLIDNEEIWHKSEWGLKSPNYRRAISFCAHSILQCTDEPMVILNTQNDWRFAQHPLVTGGPKIRFYAGAPLRTQDGFNVGTLSVIDDTPREEFSPRQRHTLKEFAAIVMREMELWRDKIQLRIRDKIQTSMEQFSRECLEVEEESDTEDRPDRSESGSGSSMDKIYERAAKLVKRTLDVEGVVVVDVSHCQVVESMNAEGTVSMTMHSGDPNIPMVKQKLPSEEYQDMIRFFTKHPEGKISEGIIPACFRSFLPTHIQYALTVPIYNIDRRLFALICAYNKSEHTKRFLEGHELSYLRAIGVIILSAVLKRRMILADKAKSMFISNISHELRTPLHGILAAAELLTESSLNPSQLSLLQTVQACGTSLVETVNHVLDFTKLSGNSKAGGVEHAITPSSVDLVQLVEEAVDGCWVGYTARTAIMAHSEIGSVYSPPGEPGGLAIETRRQHVETVLDIGYMKKGWKVKCEKGGIRRVLMNLFGNSLKFTTDGFIHVMLNQLPRSDNDPPNKVTIELVVLDTGKGISQHFLKNQLFHPFSQENPLQTGTGLGLAIVNSIVTSEAVGGKVDVWSVEGVGTEIKVTFKAEVDDDTESETENDMDPIRHGFGILPSIALFGFDGEHKGIKLLNKVIRGYLEDWWGFEVKAGNGDGDIVILNEDAGLVEVATNNRDISRPFIILSSARGNPTIMHVATEHEAVGGFCHILYKPGGPSRLRSILKLAIQAREMVVRTSPSQPFLDKPKSLVAETIKWNSPSLDRTSSLPHDQFNELCQETQSLQPENPLSPSFVTSPSMSEAVTMDGILQDLASESPSVLNTHEPFESFKNAETEIDGSLNQTTKSIQSFPPLPPTPVMEAYDDLHFRELISPTSIVPIGDSGTLLKSSIQNKDGIYEDRKHRILVVEDNGLLRNLLTKWLAKKGYDFRHAVDGQAGVSLYSKEGPFDAVLLDLSMPVLDGVAMTAEIRKIESASPDHPHARILALTGMSSLEDKRRAFEAGVDGYLIKPVAFKILDEMFHKLGLS